MKPPPPLPMFEEFLVRSPLYLAYDLAEQQADEEVAAKIKAALEAARAAEAPRAAAQPPVPPPGPQPDPAARDAARREVLRARATAKLDNLWSYAGPFDAFCPACGDSSVFEAVRPPACSQPVGNDNLGNGLYVYKHFVCTRRREQHHIRVALLYDLDAFTIIKIGQFPSLADLASGELLRYTRFKEYYPELHKASGLRAHGIGVGSYVYLRRIFERVLDDALVTARASKSWDESQYNAAARIEDRIFALRDYLPPVLVENRAVYSILSRGIHELTEEECLLHFDVVNDGIQLVLDAKLAEIERAAKEKRVRDAVARTRGALEARAAPPAVKRTAPQEPE